jgi:hypothetical protein
MATRATDTLSAIPFGLLIGAPLKAAIEAQATAAKSTVDFIEVVGFEPKDEDPFFPDSPEDDVGLGPVRNVTFSYQTQSADGEPRTAKLTVPLLTIVPIPFIRVDEMTIDFTANITETEQTSRSSSYTRAAAASLSVGYRSWWSPVSVGFRASVSTRHTSAAAAKSRFQVEYTMNVHVRAVQDEVPGGLSRVLNLLENTIKETPTQVTTTEPA